MDSVSSRDEPGPEDEEEIEKNAGGAVLLKIADSRGSQIVGLQIPE